MQKSLVVRCAPGYFKLRKRLRLRTVWSWTKLTSPWKLLLNKDQSLSLWQNTNHLYLFLGFFLMDISEIALISCRRCNIFANKKALNWILLKCGRIRQNLLIGCAVWGHRFDSGVGVAFVVITWDLNQHGWLVGSYIWQPMWFYCGMILGWHFAIHHVHCACP